MTLRTQGGKILTQGGKLSCGCCEGWWCFLDPVSDPLEPCCASQSLAMSLNFSASPVLYDPRFGVSVSGAFAARFPVAVSVAVALQKSGDKFTFRSGFNHLGLGEAEFAADVTITKNNCDCVLRITTLYLLWKWDLQAGDFSPGDQTREPAGFQYGELLFQHPFIDNSANVMSSSFKVGQSPCFPTATFSVAGKTIPGRGSAVGSILISPP